MKVIKILRVLHAPVTGITKGMVMGHNNRCLLAKHEKDPKNYYYQQIQKIQ